MKKGSINMQLNLNSNSIEIIQWQGNNVKEIHDFFTRDDINPRIIEHEQVVEFTVENIDGITTYCVFIGDYIARLSSQMYHFFTEKELKYFFDID